MIKVQLIRAIRVNRVCCGMRVGLDVGVWNLVEGSRCLPSELTQICAQRCHCLRLMAWWNRALWNVKSTCRPHWRPAPQLHALHCSGREEKAFIQQAIYGWIYEYVYLSIYTQKQFSKDMKWMEYNSRWLWLYSRWAGTVAAGGQGAGNQVAPHRGGWPVSSAAGGQTQRAGGNWREGRQRGQRRGGGFHRRWCVWGHADCGTLKGHWKDRKGEEL